MLDGSLGDYIVLLKIVEVINEACPNNEVDIFVPKNKLVFAKTVLGDIKEYMGITLIDSMKDMQNIMILL